jgi:hypothetical protein
MDAVACPDDDMTSFQHEGKFLKQKKFAPPSFPCENEKNEVKKKEEPPCSFERRKSRASKSHDKFMSGGLQGLIQPVESNDV